MELFFTPLSCALASRITMYEAGIPATFTRIDSQTKTTPDGRNYLEINPRGQVPRDPDEGWRDPHRERLDPRIPRRTEA